MRSTWLALAAVLVAPGIAQAEPKPREALFSASIEYVVPKTCPSSDDFKAVVIGRLGFDPFVADAPDHVLVSIEDGPHNLDGRLEWRDAAGNWAGDRTFPAHTTDCAELVRAMGFALAVQINLLAAGRPNEAFQDGSAEHPGAKSGAPVATKSPAAATHPEPSSATDGGADAGVEPGASASGKGTPWAFAVGAGGSLGVGMAPGAIALGRLFASAGWDRWSFELGGELSTRAVESREDGAGFAQQLWLASAAVCGSERHFSLCLLGKGGAVKASGRSIDVPAASSGKAFQAGLRFGARKHLGRVAFVAGRIEGLFNLTRWSVTLDQIPVWTAPVVAAGFGLDVGAVF